ncbi:hypothetical protein C3496_25220 [Bacillus anthracis]|nr:hypothetical protein C3496_25220 [Bacillus anthracis]
MQPAQAARSAARASYSYNPSAAVSYALKWANSVNPKYGTFGGKGGDCTNFVSQALFAGGIPMKEVFQSGQIPPILGGSANWYSVEATVGRKLSATWVNVGLFYDFWSSRVVKVTKTWSPMQVYYGSSPGDVIQYQYAGGGTKWHSLMVTGKDTNKRTIYISQHSNNRKNADYANIDKDAKGDSQWIILKFTK